MLANTCILEHSVTFYMHSGLFCMHSGTFYMHSGSFCMHSGTFCMHSGIFWNILHSFWTIHEHSACILDIVEGCRKAYFQIDHTQTDRHTLGLVGLRLHSQKPHLKGWNSGFANNPTFVCGPLAGLLNANQFFWHPVGTTFAKHLSLLNGIFPAKMPPVHEV